MKRMNKPWKILKLAVRDLQIRILDNPCAPGVPARRRCYGGDPGMVVGFKNVQSNENLRSTWMLTNTGVPRRFGPRAEHSSGRWTECAATRRRLGINRRPSRHKKSVVSPLQLQPAPRAQKLVMQREAPHVVMPACHHVNIARP